VLHSIVNRAKSLVPVAGLPSLLVLLGACGGGPDHPGYAAAPVASDEPSTTLNVGSTADAAACVGVEVMSQQLPVDLFAVLDGSSSMAEATATGVSKWYATKTAFQNFIVTAEPGMGFGLSLFPSSNDEPSCSAQHYREAALPISDVSQMAQGALARLDAVVPQGQTPTAPAFTAALELATSHAVSHLDRSVVVVLATDGLPTSCAPTDAEALAELAKEAFEGAGHVRTVVVASESLSDDDRSGFERIAKAGGTGRALTIDPRADFARQLSDALRATADRKVACDLALPEPPATERLDYDAVNVVIEGRDGRTTFPRVADSTGCTATGGWYYDVDPATAAPSRLNMCKASCERLSTTTAKLRVELGCKTVVR
jgi:hypothetical protein